MLEIRPSCEHCDKDLPADATDAMICSYECTFCADCVDSVIENTCPNCGGGFVPRPVRPAREWRPGVSREKQKVGEKRVHKPVDGHAHGSFIATLKNIPPEKR
ncbi:MAG: DUF1272 domain-containing protein [Alphaproteobacteria bacterium]|nr:DUF1272 domain-containing protein [Alphaproteobacteria bacterium]